MKCGNRWMEVAAVWAESSVEPLPTRKWTILLSSQAIAPPTQRRFPHGLFLCDLCDSGRDRVQRAQITLRKGGVLAWSKSSVQYATDVKNLLFLTRLDFLCKKTGCVPHYFQYKGHVLIFFPESKSQIIIYQILNICRVLYRPRPGNKFEPGMSTCHFLSLPLTLFV